MTTLITKKEWLSIFPEAREYLEENLTYQIEKFELLKELYKVNLDILDFKKLNNDSKEFGITMVDVFIGEDIKETERRIKETYQYIRKETSTNGITESDIQRAKEYPFGDLIKVNRVGYATCPFHKEKTASFYTKKNVGHCFGCGWHGDTIQFLMETAGVTFIEAVKSLK